MENEVKYGLQVLLNEEEEDVASGEDFYANVYKITTDETGVWVDFIASFVDKEAAHAFVRAWNGEETPE